MSNCAGVDWVLTPDGAFHLMNPQDIIPGRIHIVEYAPFERWATIVAICINGDAWLHHHHSHQQEIL